MKTANTTAAVLLSVGTFFALPALAAPKVYVPLGSADKVIIIDAEKDKVVGSIKAITLSHGLAGSSDGSFLIAGSLEENDPTAPAQNKKAPMNMGQKSAPAMTMNMGQNMGGQGMNQNMPQGTPQGNSMNGQNKMPPPQMNMPQANMAQGNMAQGNMPQGNTPMSGQGPNDTCPNMAGQKGHEGKAMDNAKKPMNGAPKAMNKSMNKAKKSAGMGMGMNMGGKKKHQAKKAGSGTAVSTLTIINTKDNSIRKRINVPGAVHHTMITPDDKFAIATHPGESGVSIINLSTYETQQVGTGPVPNYAVGAPSSDYVYVSNSGNNTVSFMDTKRWIVRRNIEVGDSPEHMILSSDGKSLFVNNTGDGTVSMIDVPSASVVNTFNIGGNIHGIDLSEDNKTLFVAAREKDKVVAVTIATGAIKSEPLSPEPYHLTTIKGTNKLYITSAGADKIFVVDQKTLKTIGEIPVEERAHQIVSLR